MSLSLLVCYDLTLLRSVCPGLTAVMSVSLWYVCRLANVYTGTKPDIKRTILRVLETPVRCAPDCVLTPLFHIFPWLAHNCPVPNCPLTLPNCPSTVCPKLSPWMSPNIPMTVPSYAPGGPLLPPSCPPTVALTIPNCPPTIPNSLQLPSDCSAATKVIPPS